MLRARNGATDVPTRTGRKCESRGDLTGHKRRLQGRLSERGVGYGQRVGQPSRSLLTAESAREPQAGTAAGFLQARSGVSSRTGHDRAGGAARNRAPDRA